MGEMLYIKELLQKFSDKTLTAGEEQYLLEWLRDNHDDWSLSLYEEYRILLDRKPQLLSEVKSAAIFKMLQTRLSDTDSAVERPGSTDSKKGAHIRLPGRRVVRMRYAAVAAAVVLLIVAGQWRYFTSGKADVLPAPALTEKINPGTTIVPVALPDGSTVLLHPHSRIVYSSSFQKGDREIHLSGKAFFEVVSNPGRPFLVHSKEMVTQVVGTSFMIDAFDERDHFSVVVKTGHVAVWTSGRNTGAAELPVKVDLKENEAVSFDRNSQAFIASGLPGATAVKETVPRTLPVYRFRDTPITEILATLSDDYGIPIRVNETMLAGCSLTTTLKDKPLFEKLRIVCEGVGPGTSFAIEGEEVIITTLGCNN